MAFCTLEEAWGPNYTSFLSSASVVPDWLKTKERKSSPQRAPSGYSVDQFKPNTPRPKEKASPDNDLLLDYDEFNVPMYYDSPSPADHSVDEYYKLIDGQFPQSSHSSQIEHFDGDYAEELQYSQDFTPDCDRSRKHLKNCKKCRKTLRELLDELEGTTSNVITKVNKSVVEPAKTEIKQLFPSHLRGYIDLIFFIAIGVFLIFVLDSFVRLGKSFAKRT